MPAPEHTSKGENLAVRFVNELTKEMAENEVVLAIGGVFLDIESGLATRTCELQPTQPLAPQLAWAIIDETVLIDALRQIDPEIDVVNTSADQARREVRAAVTREWVVTENLDKADLTYCFAITLLIDGGRGTPRVATSIYGSCAEEDAEWLSPDAAYLFAQIAEAKRGVFGETVLEPGKDQAFSGTYGEKRGR